jgi:hypothetical protein
MIWGEMSLGIRAKRGFSESDRRVLLWKMRKAALDSHGEKRRKWKFCGEGNLFNFLSAERQQKPHAIFQDSLFKCSVLPRRFSILSCFSEKRRKSFSV